MPLDINTLLVVTVANILALAAVSPAVMGQRLDPAARAVRWSLGVHAASWVCMIASNFWPETLADRLLSTLAVGGFAASNGLLFEALRHWLGKRRFRRAVWGLAAAIPLGYVLLFSSYALRVGWANGLLALQLLLVAGACFKPLSTLRGKWRLVVALGLFWIAVLTLGRGILGAFTDLYPSFLAPHPWNVAAMLMTNLLPLMVNFAMLGGWHEDAEAALQQQAITDELTGLLNRRGWLQAGKLLIANSNRTAQPMALLMLDIDFFKQINDTHGHEAGDRALQALGGLLLANRRASDVAARIGGEEFCLLLSGSHAASAQQIDARLRTALPQLGVELGFPINFSSGLAMHRAGQTLEDCMREADHALYAAKNSGRGHLESASGPGHPTCSH